jgi:hypothetical protein
MVKNKHVLCEICWENPATVTCPSCGRKVCPQHYNPKTGKCILCTETTCQICGKNLAIGSCAICGKLGCSECLIQIDNVRRICKLCAEKIGLERARKILLGRKKIIHSGPYKVRNRVLQLT